MYDNVMQKIKTMTEKTNITLTGVYVNDKENEVFTGFFSEFPEAVSQGATFEEAEEALFDVLPMVLETKDEINREESILKEKDTFRKSYTFHPA